MNVLLQNRVDMYDKNGGDVVQMVATQKELQKLGIEVTISNELAPNLSAYDIVHLYNTTRIHDTYMQYKNAKKHQKKIVISPIYHSIMEIEKYRKNGQYGLLSNLNSLLPTFYSQEVFKNGMRFLTDKKQRKAIVMQYMKGFKKQQQEVLSGVDAWVLLSADEGIKIKDELDVNNISYIAHNGVDIKENNTEINYSLLKRLPQEKFVFCVGRVEPRKNQVNLIKAMEKEKIPLVFVGNINPNYDRFFNKVYKHEFLSLVEKHSWIHWLGGVEYNDLSAIYAKAHVHVNPSWFEVVSLVNLEAGAYGCNLVLSDVGYQREYYGVDAWYCNPDDEISIATAVKEAFQANKSNKIKEKVQKEYTWENSAKATLEAYKKVLK